MPNRTGRPEQPQTVADGRRLYRHRSTASRADLAGGAEQASPSVADLAGDGLLRGRTRYAAGRGDQDAQQAIRAYDTQQTGGDAA